MLLFGLWWLRRAATAAREVGEGYGADRKAPAETIDDDFVRERAVAAREFDPAEIRRGHHSETAPPIAWAILPLVVVVAVNVVMSILVWPRLDLSFLAEERWGGTSLAAVGGVWSVATALATAIATVVVVNWSRLPLLRESMDAGANASVLPAFGVASLVGFGAVIAALPAFAVVRDWVLAIGGGPLVSLAVATNILSSLTGSASGGMTITLDALGATYLRLAGEAGIDPALLHRVTTISAGTLDSLPHNGAVVSLLAVCGLTHRESYRDMVMVGIAGAVLALLAVIVLGSLLGAF
jgi:H+/gluconate symporter-like permease